MDQLTPTEGQVLLNYMRYCFSFVEQVPMWCCTWVFLALEVNICRDSTVNMACWMNVNEPTIWHHGHHSFFFNLFNGFDIWHRSGNRAPENITVHILLSRINIHSYSGVSPGQTNLASHARTISAEKILDGMSLSAFSSGVLVLDLVPCRENPPEAPAPHESCEKASGTFHFLSIEVKFAHIKCQVRCCPICKMSGVILQFAVAGSVLQFVQRHLEAVQIIVYYVSPKHQPHKAQRDTA